MTKDSPMYAVINDITPGRATVISVHPTLEEAVAAADEVTSSSPVEVVGCPADARPGERAYLDHLDRGAVARGS